MYAKCMQRIAEGLKTPFFPHYSGTRFCSSPVIRMHLKSLENGLNSRFPVFFYLWITLQIVHTGISDIENNIISLVKGKGIEESGHLSPKEGMKGFLVVYIDDCIFFMDPQIMNSLPIKKCNTLNINQSYRIHSIHDSMLLIFPCTSVHHFRIENTRCSLFHMICY